MIPSYLIFRMSGMHLILILPIQSIHDGSIASTGHPYEEDVDLYVFVLLRGARVSFFLACVR